MYGVASPSASLETLQAKVKFVPTRDKEWASHAQRMRAIAEATGQKRDLSTATAWDEWDQEYSYARFADALACWGREVNARKVNGPARSRPRFSALHLSMAYGHQLDAEIRTANG